MHSIPILSLCIWMPIAFGFLLLACGSDRHPHVARGIALVGALLSFAVTLLLLPGFDPGTSNMQFVEKLTWISRFNAQY
ncbi:MAG: NADH-quinone oxidoreductase subunit M, partial [Burkholderiales bacterium]|nr:NADH-quinone oxidoreductase subunit M [Burkholderiales bacterium]